MEVNYSRYSYDELLEVKEVIDKDKFPQRYQRLLEEIELRIKNNDVSPQESIKEDDDKSKLWEKLTVYNFEKRLHRYTFILFFSTCVTYFLTYIVPAVFHTKLANLPAYKTEIHNIECKRHTYRYRGRDHVYYNLELTSYGFTFYVPDMKRSHCKKAEKEFRTGELVTIWYENDLIYQLANESRVVLPYHYLKRYVWHENINYSFNYMIGLIIFVSIFFKSFVNCISPNSYIPNQKEE